jgi:hypothetical protein
MSCARAAYVKICIKSLKRSPDLLHSSAPTALVATCEAFKASVRPLLRTAHVLQRSNLIGYQGAFEEIKASRFNNLLLAGRTLVLRYYFC